jgi:dienelactone hydrolase
LRTGYVDYDFEGSTFEGYLAHQAQLDARPPCTLLAHDWSGVNAGMRSIADNMARLGYVAFAMDLYGKGIRGLETEDNTHVAKGHPPVDTARLAVLGYCFGGMCALDMVRAAPVGFVP